MLLFSLTTALCVATARTSGVDNTELLRGNAVAATADTILAHKHKGSDTICHRWDWRKKALKLIKEVPAAGLYYDTLGHDKFEASSITHYKGRYVMVFDNLDEIGFVDHHLNVFSSENVLASETKGSRTARGALGSAGDSEYEVITHRTRTDNLLAVQEGVHEEETGHWHPIVYEIKVNDDMSLETLGSCKMDFDLPDGDKKGMEGGEYIDAGERGEFLIGLCEGNHCEGKHGRGKDTGNGRMIVSKLESNETGCVWATQKMMNVPKTADFKDYSDMDIHGDKGPISRIAITSQEDAAVWIGKIDLEKFEFVGEGTVLHFPRTTGDCGERYCNVEGVQFIDDRRIMTVTDRAKQDQPWTCSAKDQSVQIFALPHNKELD